jgi:hypothetical protein
MNIKASEKQKYMTFETNKKTCFCKFEVDYIKVFVIYSWHLEIFNVVCISLTILPSPFWNAISKYLLFNKFPIFYIRLYFSEVNAMKVKQVILTVGLTYLKINFWGYLVYILYSWKLNDGNFAHKSKEMSSSS